jgi:uncharacterized protein YjbI with pentapeptide repeats
MNQKELDVILEKHDKWLINEEGGEKANLSYANLCGLDLSYLDLTGADLSNVNLSRANLSSTILRDVNLNGSMLYWTNTEDIKGIEVRKIQFNTSRNNNALSYWVDLGIWTTGCFQGTKDELIESILKTHEDNVELKNKYLKAITYLEEM